MTEPQHPPAPPGAEPAIRISGVSRSFGAVHAVRDLSLDVAAGSVTALVGPNGCGKSTLMLMVASLLAPQTGTIRIHGVDPVTSPAAAKALIGWMPDQFGAWDSLRVREVLETIGAAYFLPRPVIQERTQSLLDELDLRTLAEQPAHVLSRGQKQRLGLARALVHAPKVLILDEPASGLDPAARRRLQDVVRRRADAGTTVLISSHILAELEEMSDAVVLMDGGTVVGASSVAALAAERQTWRIQSLSASALWRALQDVGLTEIAVREDARVGTGHAEAILSLPDERTAARLLQDLTVREAQIVGFGPTTGRLEAAYLRTAAARREGSR